MNGCGKAMVVRTSTILFVKACEVVALDWPLMLSNGKAECRDTLLCSRRVVLCGCMYSICEHDTRADLYSFCPIDIIFVFAMNNKTTATAILAIES